MIKIAYIIDTIATPAAGTEKQLLMLINGLDKQKFKPVLICLHNSEWLKNNKLPFEIHILDVHSLLKPNLIFGLFKFRKLHRQEKFDIVQTFFVDGNIFGSFAAKFSGIKNLISSRRNDGFWHTGLHLNLLKLFSKWTRHYLANSKAVADKTGLVENVEAARRTVIYNGLDLSKFEKLSKADGMSLRQEWKVENNHILIGGAANLRPVKNIESFILVAAKISKEFPLCRFVMVGEGPERKKLEALIKKNNLEHIFLMPGSYSNIMPVLAAFDIGLLCSRHESFSNSLIEYMAAGLPVVASKVGGNAEAILDNETGLLYETDDNEKFYNNLIRIISDEKIAKKLGSQAKQSAFQRFKREEIIKQHESFYTQIIE